jgi:hypothetical protein
VSPTTALPQVAFLASPLLGPAVWRSAAEALTDLGWRVLVAHSNAGLYLPRLGAEREVVANVYADAALPAAVGPTPMAPPRCWTC